MCSAVGSGFHVVASLLHLFADDLTDGFGHIASLGHFFLDFSSGESEVVKNHQRLTAKTCDYGVHHVVNALAGVLGLLLSKRQHRTKLFYWQTEVVELYGCFHQFKIGHGAVCSLTQSVEDVATSETLKGDTDAFALLGQLNALLHHFAHL